MTPGIRSTLAGVIFGSARVPMILNAGSVTADGDSQATAVELPYTANIVDGADDTVGVILPTPAVGQVVFVYNDDSADGLLVYPQSGGTINGGSEDAAVTIEYRTLACFISSDGINWSAAYTVHSHI